MRRARGMAWVVGIAGTAGALALREPEGLGDCNRTGCSPDERDANGCCPAKPSPAPTSAPQPQPKPAPKTCAANEHPSGGHCCRAGEEWVPKMSQCVCLDPAQCRTQPGPPPAPAPTAPPQPPPPGGAPDLSWWVGNWSISGTNISTCNNNVRRNPMSGVEVITRASIPGKLDTNVLSCRLRWDVDSTGTTATLTPGPCTVVFNGSSVLVYMTGGTLRRAGETITGTDTGAANGCSGVNYYTLTRT